MDTVRHHADAQLDRRARPGSEIPRHRLPAAAVAGEAGPQIGGGPIGIGREAALQQGPLLPVPAYHQVGVIPVFLNIPPQACLQCRGSSRRQGREIQVQGQGGVPIAPAAAPQNRARRIQVRQHGNLRVAPKHDGARRFEFIPRHPQVTRGIRGQGCPQWSIGCQPAVGHPPCPNGILFRNQAPDAQGARTAVPVRTAQERGQAEVRIGVVERQPASPVAQEAIHAKGARGGMGHKLPGRSQAERVRQPGRIAERRAVVQFVVRVALGPAGQGNVRIPAPEHQRVQVGLPECSQQHGQFGQPLVDEFLLAGADGPVEQVDILVGQNLKVVVRALQRARVDENHVLLVGVRHRQPADRLHVGKAAGCRLLEFRKQHVHPRIPIEPVVGRRAEDRLQ